MGDCTPSTTTFTPVTVTGIGKHAPAPVATACCFTRIGVLRDLYTSSTLTSTSYLYLLALCRTASTTSIPSTLADITSKCTRPGFEHVPTPAPPLARPSIYRRTFTVVCCLCCCYSSSSPCCRGRFAGSLPIALGTLRPTVVQLSLCNYPCMHSCPLLDHTTCLDRCRASSAYNFYNFYSLYTSYYKQVPSHPSTRTRPHTHAVHTLLPLAAFRPRGAPPASTLPPLPPLIFAQSS